MQNFEKYNKTTGVYWLKHSVNNICISINLRSREEIISLPTFEEYKDKSYKENLHLLDKNKVDVYEFKWQEKIFSRYDFQRYSDSYNCNTQVELRYHDMTKYPNTKQSRIFTYVDDDYYLPLPVVGNSNHKSITSLNCLKLDERISNYVWNSMRQLFKTEDKVDDYWSTMHVVYDNSEYNEDSQILFKEECILLSLYYNITHKYLMVTPDINNLDYKPYFVDNGHSKLGFQYSIDIDLKYESGEDELIDLLTNLLGKWENKHKKLLNFIMPPLGKKKIHVTMEILSASCFENDNLYIDYQIKIPDDINYTGDVKGKTHTSKSTNTDGKQWRYGHIIDLELEYATGLDPIFPKMFLEVISIDWWGRHRTEGYCYLPLTLEPGKYIQNLNSLRPEELDYVEAESRRFFVGGCHLIKDLDVLVNPQSQGAKFRYVSSGTISLTWRVLSQTHLPGSQPPDVHSDVIRGADVVLQQYKKAKATLAEATMFMSKLDGSGDG